MACAFAVIFSAFSQRRLPRSKLESGHNERQGATASEHEESLLGWRPRRNVSSESDGIEADECRHFESLSGIETVECSLGDTPEHEVAHPCVSSAVDVRNFEGLLKEIDYAMQEDDELPSWQEEIIELFVQKLEEDDFGHERRVPGQMAQWLDGRETRGGVIDAIEQFSEPESELRGGAAGSSVTKRKGRFSRFWMILRH